MTFLLDVLKPATPKTLLGVGPMSKLCVDAAIDIANEHKTYLQLIASRRQVDCLECGGGYVNNWTTNEYTQYVTKRDTGKFIILARDHGGPFQNPNDLNPPISESAAIRSAKASFECDIDSGFHVLHIDPSIFPDSSSSPDHVYDRLFELYEYCHEYSVQKSKPVHFEIGTEEQKPLSETYHDLNSSLERIYLFLRHHNLPSPLFVVAQTGTMVKEFGNVGALAGDSSILHDILLSTELKDISNLCIQYNTHLKAHNIDYLHPSILQRLPSFGIHAANVAPEFGTIHTHAIVDILRQYNLTSELDTFLEYSYNSRKWKKWVLPSSSLTTTDKAILCGHYVLSHDTVVETLEKAASKLSHKGIVLSDYIYSKLCSAIRNYLFYFGHLTK